MCVYDLSNQDVDLIVQAFKKVWEHLDYLRANHYEAA
jgi:hypothetical protein